MRILIGALTLVMVAAVGGCSNGSTPTRGAEPRVNGGFVSGTFEQIHPFAI